MTLDCSHFAGLVNPSRPGSILTIKGKLRFIVYRQMKHAVHMHACVLHVSCILVSTHFTPVVFKDSIAFGHGKH